MKVLNFLKPRILTIILFLILVAIFFIMPLIPCDHYTNLGGPDRTKFVESRFCPINPWIARSMLGSRYDYLGSSIDYDYFSFFLSYVVPYLLACTIIYLILKRKGRADQKN